LGEQNVLIVGGGVGAQRLAGQLRQYGHAGPITVIGAERHLPYDRPPLSKDVLRGERDSTTFHDVDERGVTWVLGTRAVALDPATRSVKTEDGRGYAYDVLVLAPGGRPRTIPGLEAGRGIHVLRTIDDALSLRDALRATGRLIVVGAGFIGCEIAASARQLDVQVDLIESLPAPLARVLGLRAAAEVATMHESHGVRLHTGASVSRVLRSPDGGVRGVRLADGAEIEGTHIVTGIGIVPDTEWLDGSGVELGDGIVCDDAGRTSVPGVYALGDAAQWWHELADGHRRLEHWTSTADQAGVVAEAIAGEPGAPPAALSNAPYFWSDQYDVKIQGIGFIDAGERVDQLVVRDRTVLLYSRDGIVRAVVGFSTPAAVMRTKPLIERRAPVAEAVKLLSPG